MIPTMKPTWAAVQPCTIKKPARLNVGIDIDPKVIQAWKAAYTAGPNGTSGKDSPQSTIIESAVRTRAITARAGTTGLNGDGSGTASLKSLAGDDRHIFTFIKADATWYLEQRQYPAGPHPCKQ